MIVAGFGFSSMASRDSLRDAYRQAAGQQPVVLLTTAAGKVDHPGLSALAHELDLPLRAVDAQTLSATETATRSARSLSTHGTGSVAEAAALAAAGPGARLLAPRRISTDRLATCAVAIGDQT